MEGIVLQVRSDSARVQRTASTAVGAKKHLQLHGGGALGDVSLYYKFVVAGHENWERCGCMSRQFAHSGPELCFLGRAQTDFESYQNVVL